MSDLLKYHAAMTRRLYVAIATRNKTEFLAVLYEAKKINGVIGGSEGLDCWIREGQGLFCNRHRITNEMLAFETQAGALETFVNIYPWDGTGVWIPEAPAVGGVPVTLAEEAVK